MTPTEIAALPLPEHTDADPLTEEEYEQLERLLNRLCDESFHTAASHGFWDDRPDPLNRAALFGSEVAEFVEEIRKGKAPDHVYYREQDGKPEGCAAELADVVIRCADSAKRWRIPLGRMIVEKLRFNKGRPFMHGKTA